MTPTSTHSASTHANEHANEPHSSGRSASRKNQQWYRPTVSPNSGAYVVLVMSFLIGAAAAQQWTWTTTLTLICAYCAFQAEHPLALQIRKRRSWKPRFLAWFTIYGGVSGAIALWLLFQSFSHQQPLWPLLGIYGVAIAVAVVDAISVWQRQQKAIWNELITFAAICLSAPLAYVATLGDLSWQVIGLWILNTLFFSSAIFTVKLRKLKTSSIMPGLIFHSVATVVIALLWQVHWLAPFTAAAFGVVLLKFGLILWQKEWYRSAKIQYVAQVETLSSLLFLVIAALSLLPSHLN
ncbi:MAG: YwiC-like family protein [Cyanobacteria bacterium P01_F01_bin.150]